MFSFFSEFRKQKQIDQFINIIDTKQIFDNNDNSDYCNNNNKNENSND